MKALSFSSDGRTLAAVNGNGQASIWDVESRSLRHGGIPADGEQVGVAFTKDGKTLAAASSSGIGLWDAETGESIGSIPAYLPYEAFPRSATTARSSPCRSEEAACRGQRSGMWPGARAWPR